MDDGRCPPQNAAGAASLGGGNLRFPIETGPVANPRPLDPCSRSTELRPAQGGGSGVASKQAEKPASDPCGTGRPDIQDVFDRKIDDLNRPKREYLELDWLDHRAELLRQRCTIAWGDLPCGIPGGA
ncbi:unnamed protein product, partial [Prorocentrum cordatum]